MVGNFHEGFIFVFFASQGPFVKMKPQNFCCSHGKRTHRVSICPTWNYLCICQQKQFSEWVSFDSYRWSYPGNRSAM